jgi:Lon protease-like protein
MPNRQPFPLRRLPDGAYLLDVLSRDEGDKVLCQAPGCRHPVFARVHVVADPRGVVRVLGSSCFKALHFDELREGSAQPNPGSAVLSLPSETREGYDDATRELVEQYRLAFQAHQRREQRLREIEQARQQEFARKDRNLSVLRTLYGKRADQELAGPRREEILERTRWHLAGQPALEDWSSPANASRLEAEARDLLVQWLAHNEDEAHEHEPALF